MTEIGVVKSITKDTAEVAVVKKSSCGENCKGCSGGCKLTENIITVKNTIGAKIGDVVEIEASSKAVLGRAFLIYILPIAVFFAVYFITYAFIHSESGAVLLSLAVFCAMFFLFHFMDKNKKLAVETDIVKIMERS